MDVPALGIVRALLELERAAAACWFSSFGLDVVNALRVRPVAEAVTRERRDGDDESWVEESGCGSSLESSARPLPFEDDMILAFKNVVRH